MDAKLARLRSVGKVLTTAVANTVYTCPPNYIAKMVLLIVSNHGANNKTIQVEWNDVSASGTYHIVGGYNLTAYNFLKFDTSYLVLNAGDSLILTPEAGSTMDATVTVEEYFEPTQGI
jgi:hypothetical protein